MGKKDKLRAKEKKLKLKEKKGKKLKLKNKADKEQKLGKKQRKKLKLEKSKASPLSTRGFPSAQVSEIPRVEAKVAPPTSYDTDSTTGAEMRAESIAPPVVDASTPIPVGGMRSEPLNGAAPTLDYKPVDIMGWGGATSREKVEPGAALELSSSSEEFEQAVEKAAIRGDTAETTPRLKDLNFSEIEDAPVAAEADQLAANGDSGEVVLSKLDNLIDSIKEPVGVSKAEKLAQKKRAAVARRSRCQVIRALNRMTSAQEQIPSNGA